MEWSPRILQEESSFQLPLKETALKKIKIKTKAKAKAKLKSKNLFNYSLWTKVNGLVTWSGEHVFGLVNLNIGSMTRLKSSGLDLVHLTWAKSWTKARLQLHPVYIILLLFSSSLIWPTQSNSDLRTFPPYALTAHI